MNEAPPPFSNVTTPNRLQEMHNLPEDKVSELALGPTIKRLRLDCELTQAKFAEALGITTNSINRYEAGALKPGLGTLTKLHRFAVEHNHGPAAYLFSRVLEPNFNLPFDVAISLDGPARVTLLHGEAKALSDDQTAIVLALMRLLADRSSQDKTVYDILHALVRPYLSQAQKDIRAVAVGRHKPKSKSSKRQ